MKLKTLTALIVTTYMCFNFVTQASAPQPVFTPEQEARIGELAAGYLVTNPEVLVTVSQKLQDQQQLRKQKLYALNVMEHQTELLQDPDTPTTGPKGARVAVIEFFDYQCVVCAGAGKSHES